MADATGAAGTGDAGAAGAAGAAAAWHTGKVDAETLGFWQNKGYDVNDPVAVATTLTKQYREAEKFIGVPPDQVIRIPKADDAAGLAAMRQRLGAPDKPEGYDFSGVKFSDGTAVDDEAFLSVMRSTAHAYGLSKDAAAGIAAAVLKHVEGLEAGEAATSQATLAQQQAALKQNWGPNFDANLFVARRAAQSLGIDPAAVEVLEKQVGYDKVMEMFRSIGTKMGEDTYVKGSNPAGNGVMTQGQAQARINELKSDSAWVKRYMDGGKNSAEWREMQALHIMVHGDDTAESDRWR